MTKSTCKLVIYTITSVQALSLSAPSCLELKKRKREWEEREREVEEFERGGDERGRERER